MCCCTQSCELGCVMFARVLLIFFNIIFVLAGLTLIGLGAWLLADPKVYEILGLVSGATNSGLIRASAILLIIIGCVLVLVTFLGFIGAILQNKIVLGIYIALLVITYCGEIAGAVLAIAFKDWMLAQLNSKLLDSLKSPYYFNDTTTFGSCNTTSSGASWDIVQAKLGCCGVFNAPQSGYEIVTYSLPAICPATVSVNKPYTCCANYIVANSNYRAGDYRNCPIRQNGCESKIVKWIGYYSPVLIGIGLGVAMIQLIGLIFAVCVCVNSPWKHGHYKKTQ